MVSLSPSAALLLQEHRDKQEAQRAMLGIPLKDDDLIFSDLAGKPLLPDTVSHVWAKLVKRAGLEGTRFHDALLGQLKKHAISQTKEEWGYPSGVTYCDTYSFSTKHGMLYLGHYDYTKGDRWWIPITMEEQVSGAQLPVTFEMSIPKTRNMHVSVHYGIEDNGLAHILEKGKFTVGYGSVGM